MKIWLLVGLKHFERFISMQQSPMTWVDFEDGKSNYSDRTSTSNEKLLPESLR